MSERITASHLDEVVEKNRVIREEIENEVLLIQTRYNGLKVNSSVQLAFQLLKEKGLIQIPIENRYLSGAIFVRNGKKIPILNTALPRVNQYFTAWHEIYHLFFDTVSFDHVIETDTLMEERKADYFASKMLLGNLMPYFEELHEMDFLSKIFSCMDVFQAPYKAVLIALYESAVKSENQFLEEKVKKYFDVPIENIAEKFRNLGLDNSLVQPSYVVNVTSLQIKLKERMQAEPELNYHRDNEVFLNHVMSQIKKLIGEINA
ncbi:MAG: ImmA/IrrE family metallo-endopeptidase [Lachnospiraceae bacterium]